MILGSLAIFGTTGERPFVLLYDSLIVKAKLDESRIEFAYEMALIV